MASTQGVSPATVQASNDEIDKMDAVYAFATQQQEKMTMVSTLGQLQEDAAKDKPQV